MRECGILYPISSLPSKYGIGCFSIDAYKFIDFLHMAGHGYWQVLPFGPTGYGDSPYQSFSTFAGNPYFISFESLIEDGLLKNGEPEQFYWGTNPSYVDYGAQYESRFKVLRIAFGRFKENNPDKKGYDAFVKKNSYWLKDYALYMAIKEKFEGKSWAEWDDEYKFRDPKAIKKAGEELKDTIDFFCFQQYEFDKQWAKIHEYAKEKQVSIIGDIPIYTSFDSADTWSHPEQFQFDKDLNPTKVAGCPPDAFSATGQLWGNAVYDWKYLKKHHYKWWVDRIRRNYEFYDVIRVDHFRGFDEYYAIPFGEETAKNGEWEKGPGMNLFNAIRKQLGDVRIIAEDLGYITPTVRKLLKDSGFPGMKVLQFAFDDTESSDYLPYNHIENSVVYTGTHDNETTRGWIENLNEHDRDFARRYINSIYTDYGQFVWDMIREAYRSVCMLCIIPIQDYLVVGNEGRMNCPSTFGTNWQWRTTPNLLSESLNKSIRDMAKLYGRLHEEPEEETEEEEASLKEEDN